MIIATAGHVDHGKTSLIQAITGVNADRLPEEKARGMTIDLGYAYWPQPDGDVPGFIDVPGHEKFLANMLSGIGGIDHALLVVAADDGVMPQTREHLAILSLSGQPPLSIVITKADAADDARIDAVKQESLALAAGLGWPKPPLFVTSTVDGRGITALADALRQLPARSSYQHTLFRLAVDRAFNVKGAGVVVTGTALGGTVRTGDKLWLSGCNKTVRVRGLHAQNQPVEAAFAGQRIALNITGGVEKDQIARGDWLLEAPPAAPSDRVIVALQMLTPLKQGQTLHIHHAASHITGRIALLNGTLAELILDTPLWLADNDRLILRDIGAQQTLAGARVVLLTPKRRGKRQPDYLAWLEALRTAENHSAALALILQAQPGERDALGWARQLTPDGLKVALAPLALFDAGNTLLLAKNAEAWQAQILQTLGDYHEKNRDRAGLGRDRLRRMALPHQPAQMGLLLIDQLLAQGKLRNHHGWLSLPDFDVRFGEQEGEIWQRVAPLFQEEAWWVRDLAKAVDVEESAMRQTLHQAAQMGEITAIVKDRYFSSQQMTHFANLIRQRAAEGQSTSAGDFRDQLGTGRKLAVQVLEFFDRCGFTRRKGNAHLLRDTAMFE